MSPFRILTYCEFLSCYQIVVTFRFGEFDNIEGYDKFALHKPQVLIVLSLCQLLGNKLTQNYSTRGGMESREVNDEGFTGRWRIRYWSYVLRPWATLLYFAVTTDQSTKTTGRVDSDRIIGCVKWGNPETIFIIVHQSVFSLVKAMLRTQKLWTKFHRSNK